MNKLCHINSIPYIIEVIEQYNVGSKYLNVPAIQSYVFHNYIIDFILGIWYTTSVVPYSVGFELKTTWIKSPNFFQLIHLRIAPNILASIRKTSGLCNCIYIEYNFPSMNYEYSFYPSIYNVVFQPSFRSLVGLNKMIQLPSK